jgi:hypothetical protein
MDLSGFTRIRQGGVECAAKPSTRDLRVPEERVKESTLLGAPVWERTLPACGLGRLGIGSEPRNPAN